MSQNLPEGIESLSIRFFNNKLSILDQQALPVRQIWVECETPADMIDCIKKLKIRGAPAIGIGAALSLLQYARKGATGSDLVSAARALRGARPTAVNLMYAVDRLVLNLSEGELTPEHMEEVALDIFEEDRRLCDDIARNGYDLIKDGDNILTHCNTGGLATAGVGTALGIIRRAHERGKKIHVYVDETRPLLQGGRLTAWELSELGIPYTLICDNMAAGLMRAGKVDSVMVGADRIALNGDFANKVGTYNLAVLCAHHHLPLYVAAPTTTLDPNCADGSNIPIEERKDDEVRGYQGVAGEVIWSPRESPVYNPAFDVTPAELVAGHVLETGFFSPAEIRAGVLRS